MTEHHLEILSLKGGCTVSSESILVKMPHCWKSDVVALIFLLLCVFVFFCFLVFLSYGDYGISLSSLFAFWPTQS